MQCQNIISRLSENIAIPTPEYCPNPITRRLQTAKVKKAGKEAVRKSYLEEAKDKANQLESQGAFARLLADEQMNISWQSLIFSVPKGVMAWAARASTNCLASPDNLAKWKRIVDPKRIPHICHRSHRSSIPV